MRKGEIRGPRRIMLFRLPLMVFNEIMKKYKVMSNQKSFDLIWMDAVVSARYVVLPDHSDEPISLVFADLEQTKFRSIRLMLVKGIPPVYLNELDYTKLNIYSSIIVSELEDKPSDHHDKGFDTRLCMEFASSDSGIVDVTNDKILPLDLVSTHMKSVMYDFYMSPSYKWTRDSVRFNTPSDFYEN